MDERMEQQEEGDKDTEPSEGEMEEKKPGEGKANSDEEDHLLETAPGEEEGEDLGDNIANKLIEDQEEVKMKQQEEVKERTER